MTNAHHIENTLVSMRDESSFEMMQLAKSSHRQIYKIMEKDGVKYIDSYEPEQVAESYLEAELAKLGTVTRFEQYVTSSLFMCCRGCVERGDRVYWFNVQYDKLYLTMVEGLVAVAQLTLDGRKAS